MAAGDEKRIRVQSAWNGWRSAEVRLGDLLDVHWLQPPRAPHPLVHGVVECAKIMTGHIPHDCDPRSAPHRLRVCILKRHTASAVYAELARRADERCQRGVGAPRVADPGDSLPVWLSQTSPRDRGAGLQQPHRRLVRPA